MKKLFISLLSAIFVLTAMSVSPTLASYPRQKVVIVVGPVGAKTRHYKTIANGLADVAKDYGAQVIKIYSPYATWARVKKYAQKANLFIYLGHGNGYPSPYSWSTKTKDGLGLNSRYGHGNYNVKYYGEYYIKTYIKFAKNAVVLLNHLCYASGSAEPGMASPSLSTAKKRVDNYAAGFLSAGARAVFAYGYSEGAKLIRDLYRTSSSFKYIFKHGTYATPGSYIYSARSRRHPRMHMILDPWYRGAYYRSVVGKLYITAAQWRAG